MRSFRTRTIVAALAADLALSTAACSADEDDDTAATTTTAPVDQAEATTAPPTDGETTTTAAGDDDPMADRREQLYQQYLDRGLDEDEASCMADEVVDGSIAASEGEEVDPMAMFEACDVAPETMDAEGDGTAEGAFASSLADGLTALGYTEEQASCFADEFVGRYGMDLNAAADPEVVDELMTACGGDPALLDQG